MTGTPTSKEFAPVRGKFVRLTRLDACGVPVIGNASQWVSKGFVHVNMKAAWSKANDVTVVTADNSLAVNEPGMPELMSLGVDVQLTKVNPDVISLLTGYQTVLDGAGNSVGYRGSSGIQLTAAFGIEVWSDVAGAQCSATEKPYGYLLIPFLKGATLGDWNVDSGAANISISATTHEGTGWGAGPYKVVDTDTTGSAPTPGPLLTPMGAKDHFHMQVTTVAPPAETSGLAALLAGDGAN